MKHLDLSIPLSPIEALQYHPENPRHGDVESIEDSIRENGFYNPIVVQASTNHVLIGNHRLKAARRLGLTEAPVLFIDVDDMEAKRIMLSDNATADKAVNDDMAIARIMRQLDQETGNTHGTGYDEEEVDDFIVLANHADAEAARIAAAAEAEAAAPPSTTTPAAPAATPGAPTPGVTTPREAQPTATPAFTGENNPTSTPPARPVNSTRRPMILDLPLEIYAWLTDRLDDVKTETGLETNVEAVLHAVAEATGTQAPALSAADKRVSDPATDGVGELAE